MKHNLTFADLQLFLQRVGEQIADPASLYLIGGAALRLLGSPRPTLDVDYVGPDRA